MKKRAYTRRLLFTLAGLTIFLIALMVKLSQAPMSVTPEIWPTTTGGAPLDPAIETRVEELLQSMTIEEMVGQTIQADIASVTPDEVKEYGLGSVLNGGNSAPNNNVRASAAEWLALADEFYNASKDTSDGRKGIPALWGTDAVHGHNNVIGATLFPHNIGLGATRNIDLMRQIGRITAREVSVTGMDWTFAPTLAVVKDDCWGRTYEGYSEDPNIVKNYSTAVVQGLQGELDTPTFLGNEQVIATAKHFLGDGGTVNGTDRGDNQDSEDNLRDRHGAGYPPAIEAGVQTVMASFSSWNGEQMHGHKGLLTHVLKERMGFNGFVVGDWDGHGKVPGCSNSSCPEAYNAGLDMFMAPESWKRLYENTVEQVKSGEIPRRRLEDAARRILRVKLRLGLFEKPSPSARPLAGNYELLGAPEHLAVARQAARESLVLLKNQNKLLPLKPNQRVLVAGDGAHNIGKQSGGWTLSWQGTGNSNGSFPNGESIWEGIREAVEAGGGEAELSVDGTYEEVPDVAIVVFGEDPYAEFKGDLDHLEFTSELGLELLKSFQAEDIPTVAVFLTGRPLWVNPELNASDAFVVAWLPGSQGGGVADVLVRQPNGAIHYDFKGKLSFSWPRTAVQTVNRGDTNYDPLFPY
ncbi:MAG: glycoside hydrolase family 3 protein [Cyanobacteria bacterium P01_E01_bin.34]